MRKLGSLQILDSFAEEKAPWILVFHGYGADANDLFPLHDVLSIDRPLNWIFPQGPIEIPVGPGWTGRAWWNIDLERIQNDAMAGRDRDLSTESNPELPGTRKKVLSMIEALKVPWDQIILAGFSQGGMLATDIFLDAPQTPKGLIVWSSALVNKDDWKKRIQSDEYKARAPFQFFQSHGTNDSVLTLKNGQRLESFLQSAGGKGKLHSFPGVHEINPGTILGTREYLQRIY